MKDLLHLGIVVDKEGKMVSHRSLFKIVVNPFLRMVGWNVATVVDIDSVKVIGLELVRCPMHFNLFRNLQWSWVFALEDRSRVIKKRCLY